MPTIKMPAKFAKALKPKRFKVFVGGRGSGKSMNIATMLVSMVDTAGFKILCLREFQSSIEDSVKGLIESEIERLGLTDFVIQHNAIHHKNGGAFKFMGIARNPQSVKSSHGFNVAFIEESQFLSEESLRLLTPTIREAGSELWFAANPMSAEDPFSKRFLNDCWDELRKNGEFEDDLHLVTLVNYSDNPFFPEELEQERLWDYQHLPRAMYDHIWEGDFNDSVDNALIQAEWFDQCIDAHLKLGFKEVGAIFSAHDPSDTGADAKGFAVRSGVIVREVLESDQGDANEGCDWATGLARQYKSDYFIWDCDGLGVSLNRQVVDSFKDLKVEVVQFKGSQGVERPKELYQGIRDSKIDLQKSNQNTFRNKRAQYYVRLRDRIYNTYRAVKFGDYRDPSELISFDSSITHLKKLRSELSRIPIRPNSLGMIQLYSKEDMLSRFQIPSPNLADAVMMLWIEPAPAVDASPIEFSDWL